MQLCRRGGLMEIQVAAVDLICALAAQHYLWPETLAQKNI